MHVTHRRDIMPYRTKDTSEIRELLNPATSDLRNISLAEATLAPGAATQAHHHPRADEIYYILHGSGTMWIEDAERVVSAGDAIAIPAGRSHTIRNTGHEPLTFLCACGPAYSHDDTVLRTE